MMKYILFTFLILVRLSAFSQQDLHPLENTTLRYPEMDQYKGTWRGQTDGIILTLTLTERYLQKIPFLDNAYIDYLIGYHEIKKDGKVISSSLVDSNHKALDKKYTIDLSFFPKNFRKNITKLTGSVIQEDNRNFYEKIEVVVQGNKLILKITPRERLNITFKGDLPPKELLPSDKTFVLERVK
ncbi:DUF6705 family protein [Sphingobacterium corticibacter]|uniref:DUF6705 domain-containing protein n=1 Tax=Sphingobacterium corticibacter TaxID=2171749 RepID=A0A2T8HG81_9SPHI|nr:DUF6705 family protein [Sphingobacterium corticibacter]PVH24451.1 hypothetical protein DC487_12970 [Sphingobacterium corticibacter]